MEQVHARLVGPDVGQLVQRGDLHTSGVAGVATLKYIPGILFSKSIKKIYKISQSYAVQKVSSHEHQVEQVLQLLIRCEFCNFLKE